LLGSILNAGYRSSVASATGDLTPELAHQVEDGIGSAYAAASELGVQGAPVLQAAREALVDGWRLSMWVGVAMAAATLAVIVWRAPRREDETQLVDLDAELVELTPEPALAR
jgi:hypothetical protein